MGTDDGIREVYLDASKILLFQTECPNGHSRGGRPCYALPDATPLYCAARMRRAGIHPAGGTWMHTCRGVVDPHPIRILLPQRAHCPNCKAVFIPVPGEIENPWRPRVGPK